MLLLNKQQPMVGNIRQEKLTHKCVYNLTSIAIYYRQISMDVHGYHFRQRTRYNKDPLMPTI